MKTPEEYNILYSVPTHCNTAKEKFTLYKNVKIA